SGKSSPFGQRLLMFPGISTLVVGARQWKIFAFWAKTIDVPWDINIGRRGTAVENLRLLGKDY
ncbi:hypothetical protein, partial [Microseira wollei]|uniref:hypothetical protein n=1 Tax=Microseira wollei TaxID=467598 RepID=UPI001CFE1027